MTELGREVERQIARMRLGSVDFVGETELRVRLSEALRERRPLRVKLGMDPSAPDLHLGHTVALEKLRIFQGLGHTPIFLIGDFTARIGDPTGKKKTRPPLDEAAVQENARTYVEQVRRVLDVERAEIRFNSEWMERFTPADFVRLCSRYTVARMLERDDFAKRLRDEVPISIHELLYPLVQAYDSVALKADVELGGTDQLFNLLVGREIQKDYGQRPQAVITQPLLVGLDGREKMSKSLGNTIGITDAPADAFGKTMSIPDAAIVEWAKVLGFGAWTDLEQRASSGEAPMALKQELARRIVTRLHGDAAAAQAADHFRRVVQGGERPSELPKIELPGAPDGVGLLDALRLAFALASNGEARRLVAQGAVQIDERVERDAARRLGQGVYLVRAGKRRFAKVVIGG
ncbi:MAG TPA: tyrosine--tRNA ligase [Myxococcota bacterium]|nr:tyrosine--tRNA ligase [Myxococcota bacterium]